MPIILYVDWVTLVIVLIVMAFLDTFAYKAQKFLYAIMAAALGIYTWAALVLQQNIVIDRGFDAVNHTFTDFKADPNIYAVILLVMILFSIALIFLERTE